MKGGEWFFLTNQKNKINFPIKNILSNGTKIYMLEGLAENK